MTRKKPDFFIPLELNTVASSDSKTPELAASGNFSFAQEREKLKELLNACEQHSNR